MSRTKDERFVLHVYDVAIKTGDVHVILDRYAVGQGCGLSPKAVDTICKLLIQANFIKKVSASEIMLTDGGEALVHRLRGEQG